jgi:hypothetical protein
MSLERFQWLKDEFSDEIPDRVLHFGDFKVRRIWWQGLVSNLERGLGNGVVPEELRPEVERFVEHYTSKQFHNQRLTSEADIKRANGLLDRILGKSTLPPSC